MEPKPTKLPEWASGVGAAITEPSGSKKTTGWVAEKPPHQWFNWLLNLIYQWLGYFDDLVPDRDNGVLAGAAKTSGFPQFLSAGATTQKFSILGATTPLELKIDDEYYKLEADLLSADLALAPSTLNTATANDGDGSAPTCYWGEYGGRIDLVATPGANIEATEPNVEAFMISNGANDEICLARYTTTSVGDPGYHLMPLIRGVCGTDRQPITSASTTITLLKAHWIFLNSDMTTIKTTPNYPSWDTSAPGSPSTDDFWYNRLLRSWARYNGSTWVYEGYMYLGFAVCDDTYCIGVHCEDFIGIDWDELLEYKKMANDRYASNDYLRVQGPGRVNVAGNIIHLPAETVLDTNSPGETGNGGYPWYYVYLKPDGTFITSPKGPRKMDARKGWYHPSEYWRCIGLYNRNIYSETHGYYEPESGLLLMEWRADIGSGEPGVMGYNMLTGQSIDGPESVSSYPRVPPIVNDFHVRIKAYATAGTPPNDIYLRNFVDSFINHSFNPVHTVGALNEWQTSFVHILLECARVSAYYFGNGTTSPLTYTTLQMHFCSGRIKF